MQTAPEKLNWSVVKKTWWWGDGSKPIATWNGATKASPDCKVVIGGGQKMKPALDSWSAPRCWQGRLIWISPCSYILHSWWQQGECSRCWRCKTNVDVCSCDVTDVSRPLAAAAAACTALTAASLLSAYLGSSHTWAAGELLQQGSLQAKK